MNTEEAKNLAEMAEAKLRAARDAMRNADDEYDIAFAKYAEAIALEKGVKVGTVLLNRGRKMRVDRFTNEYGRPAMHCVIFKKDGTDSKNNCVLRLEVKSNEWQYDYFKWELVAP